MNLKFVKVSGDDDELGSPWSGHPFTARNLAVGKDGIVSITADDRWPYVSFETDEPASLLALEKPKKTYVVRLGCVEWMILA